MPLLEKLLAKLVCPDCRGKLDYEENKDFLVCKKCRLTYRIIDNIPVLLPDEAEKL